MLLLPNETVKQLQAIDLNTDLNSTNNFELYTMCLAQYQQVNQCLKRMT